MYFPASLIEATKLTFEKKISGYLLDARPVGAGFKAAIFFDIHNQSDNGDTIVTDDVGAMEEEHGYSLAITASGDRYVIVSFLMFMLEEVDGIEQTVILSMTRDNARMDEE